VRAIGVSFTNGDMEITNDDKFVRCSFYNVRIDDSKVSEPVFEECYFERCTLITGNAAAVSDGASIMNFNIGDD